MEFIKPGKVFDFMKYRKVVIGVSGLLVIASIASVFYPGPNYGIDFAGGTELQLKFKSALSSGEVRKTLQDLGYERPQVVSVEGSTDEYMVRVREVSTLSKASEKKIEENLSAAIGGIELQRIKFSPGGDKLSVALGAASTPEAIQSALENLGVQVREVSRFGKQDEYRYEAQLVGVGDRVVKQLQDKLGAKGPESPRRIEWVGPRAGEQLKEAAIKSLLYAVAFIMLYVAFRFDLRFAPGGVVAMLHDAILVVGFYVLLQKEVNLTMIAAVLTIAGYSINDTIVVFDRIRENMGRLRNKGFIELINISTSQMFSRTVVTSLTTAFSIGAFFVWGTPVIQDIAFALLVGIAIGTYSSIYIAAPITEWMDRKFFRGSVERSVAKAQAKSKEDAARSAA